MLSPIRCRQVLAAFFMAAAAVVSCPVYAARPTVQWLRATPAAVAVGGNTTLRWSVDGASSVSIDHGIGAVAAVGTTVITPATTTIYTLSATNGEGTTTLSHTVVVGPNPTVAGGRYVNMVAPTGGQRFTAPATLRTFAAAFDPNGVNCGVGGTADRCAARVDFYVDGTVMAPVPASQSEYWVFKATFSGVGAGVHRVWARATYVNPPAALDSESVWITVENPPTYTQTIDLTQDVVLSGTQNYELLGSASGRIRLNGHGHRIRSNAGWSGHLTLTSVDLFDFGADGDTTPSLDVDTTTNLRVEDCVFDTTGTVALGFSGTAAATIRGNTFRSNQRMPEAQQPEFGSDASYPAIALSGNSSATKLFQGNTIGIGWADFRNTNRWLIGGDTDADGNVVIGARGGLWVQNTTQTTVRGNLVYHIYYGGWSQGNVMELNGASDLVVEHNMIGGGSWPIRGFGGTLRYNLVLDAGHQWLWITDDNAVAHHNVFVGGDSDVAGIWMIYGPQNVHFYNNTIDGLNRDSVIQPIWVGRDGALQSTAQLRSNAVVNTPHAPAVVVDGILDADYSLYYGQQGTAQNYSDGRRPAHDVGVLNAQIDPKFLGPSEPLRHSFDDLWTRRITARQLLTHYRQRYTPGVGSPLIDAGDPGSGPADRIFQSGFETATGGGSPGNDIGAVGAGLPAADDLFGRY